MKCAIYPGSFDPVTLGHLDIIKRAAAIFEELIVCVSVNSAKPSGLFTPQERVELIQAVTADLPNVRVDCSQELVAEYARRNRARVLVKGLRSDYESEIQMAMLNAKLYARLDTVFLYTRPKYAFLSSTVVKELARYGADLSDFVPRQIIDRVRAKVADSGQGGVLTD